MTGLYLLLIIIEILLWKSLPTANHAIVIFWRGVAQNRFGQCGYSVKQENDFFIGQHTTALIKDFDLSPKSPQLKSFFFEGTDLFITKLYQLN